MQETQNYNSYLNRYMSLDRTVVLDGREIVADASRRFFESVYTRLDFYFNDPDFRAQVPLDTRMIVEDNYLNPILSYIDTIASWQRDGTTQINGPNLAGQIQMISSMLTSFDQTMSGYYFAYLASSEPQGQYVSMIRSMMDSAQQESQSLQSVIDNVKEQANQRHATYETGIAELESEARGVLEGQRQRGEDTLSDVREILTKAELLIGQASGQQLGDHYHKLANGRTLKDHDEYISAKGKGLGRLIEKISIKKMILPVILLLFMSYAVTMYLIFNPIKIDIWFSTLLVIIGVISSLSLIAYVFIVSIKAFIKHFPGGHERTAALWMGGAILSTLFTAVYSGVLIRDMSMNGPITWESIIPKVIVLLAPAYLVRLCVQNYRANAHLAVQYMHRATIMNIAESYSKAASVESSQINNPDLVKAAYSARMMILTDAAKIMFAQSESGYITQKEGAGGNGDNMIDSLHRN